MRNCTLSLLLRNTDYSSALAWNRCIEFFQEYLAKRKFHFSGFLYIVKTIITPSPPPPATGGCSEKFDDWQSEDRKKLKADADVHVCVRTCVYAYISWMKIHNSGGRPLSDAVSFHSSSTLGFVSAKGSRRNSLRTTYAAVHRGKGSPIPCTPPFHRLHWHLHESAETGREWDQERGPRELKRNGSESVQVAGGEGGPRREKGSGCGCRDCLECALALALARAAT